MEAAFITESGRLSVDPAHVTALGKRPARISEAVRVSEAARVMVSALGMVAVLGMESGRVTEAALIMVSVLCLEFARITEAALGMVANCCGMAAGLRTVSSKSSSVVSFSLFTVSLDFFCLQAFFFFGFFLET